MRIVGVMVMTDRRSEKDARVRLERGNCSCPCNYFKSELLSQQVMRKFEKGEDDRKK
jgi:hypothetical protein